MSIHVQAFSGPRPIQRQGRTVRARASPFDALPLPDGEGFYHPNQSLDKLTLYGPESSTDGFVLSTARHLRPGHAAPGLERYHSPRPPIPFKRPDQEVRVTLFEGRLNVAEIVVFANPTIATDIDVGGVLVGLPDDTDTIDGDEDSVNAFSSHLLLPSGTTVGLLPPPRDYDAPDFCLDPSEQVQDNAAEEEVVFIADQKSPRRTLRIQFRCNICSRKNINQVNPAAWHHGTVFIECGHCHTRHKMVDNLDIVHEMKGPTFSGMSPAELEHIRSIMPPHLLPIPDVSD